MADSKDDLRQKFIDALTHTTRALAGNDKLKVVFQEVSSTETDVEHLVLPPLPAHLASNDIAIIKGFADRQAFLYRYGWPKDLQSGLQVSTNIFTDIIKPIESARAEVLGKESYAGTAPHLDLISSLEAKNYEENNSDVPIGYLLSLYLRENYGQKLSKQQEKVIDDNKHLITPEIKDWLKHAPKYLHSQKEQILVYKELLDLLGISEQQEQQQQQGDDKQGNESEEQAGSQGHGENDENEDNTNVDVSTIEQQDNELAEDTPPSEEGSEGDAANPNRPSGDESQQLYKAYTTEFDSIIKAEKQVTQAEMSRLKERFRMVTSGNRAVVSQLAVKLQRFLLAQTEFGWRLDQEEGFIDPRKLSQVVTSSEPRPYRLPLPRHERDTVVTLLVDNSGSMRGRPIEMAAVSADVLARTLERCGVKVEVLGFTTQTWKGGQSRLDWIANGSPDNPGRLNDLLHVVYKEADASYRHAKPGFAVMLADDLLKENIDGESLVWAYSRLLKRTEKRKILLVISDGAPVDYATDKHNPPNYLDAHLRYVINQIEKKGMVELLAIGIGHDVRRYYRNAVTIEDPSQLGQALVDRMVYLFSTHDRTPKAVEKYRQKRVPNPS